MTSFGDVTALEASSLGIACGERTSLIDPSGSGKTTISRILMTLENILKGSIWIEGPPLWNEAFAREFSDRVIFMENGQIVEDSAPNKLFTDPEQQSSRPQRHLS